MMLTSLFDYELPPELIAQHPPERRCDARLLVLECKQQQWSHTQFTDLPCYLRRGDLLVRNDTRVFPARLIGTWADTGGRVELLLLEPVSQTERSGAIEQWHCLAGSGRRARSGLKALFGGGAVEATIEAEAAADGSVVVAFRCAIPMLQACEEYGQPPLPPYIARRDAAHRAHWRQEDLSRYQTVYAREAGAVAAPTAGLHFTPSTFKTLQENGVEIASVTLHVGLGTFRPVQAERLSDHKMHSERYVVPETTAAAIRACRARGGRILAVGSTTVRTLETVAAAHDGQAVACSGRSELFIHEPYIFKFTDLMLTNFHLPRSTLLMMVAALAGHDLIMTAYQDAIAQRYRFFSYGDAMLIIANG